MVQQIRWATLNDTRHVDDQDPKEVQIERCLEKYQRTLRLHQRGKLAEAKKLYNDLLQNEVMRQTPLTQAPKELDVEGSATVSMATPLALLQFLVFKNYASILEEEYNNDEKKPKELAEKALDHYINALSIDPSARMLWYHTGTLARAIRNMRLAKLAFGNGLLLQSSWNTQGSDAIHPDSIIHSTPPDELAFDRFSPSQWWCLEGLCETLLEIGDYATCEYYYENVMKQLGQWKYGETIMERIRQSRAYDGSEAQDNGDNMHLDNAEIGNSLISKALDLSLRRTTWADLCHVLLDQYFDIVREIPVIPVASEHPSHDKSHLALFVNQKVTISLDEKNHELTTNDQENETTIEQNTNNTDNMVVDIGELPAQITKTDQSAAEDEEDEEPKLVITEPSTEAIKATGSDVGIAIDESDEMKTNIDAEIDNQNEGRNEVMQDKDNSTAGKDEEIKPKHGVSATELEEETAIDTDAQDTRNDVDRNIAEQLEQEPTDSIGDTLMDLDTTATHSNSQVGDKRKFEEVDNENDGSEEDEGPEITRSSLRASKRERDKIEHEESTRKRVQHEEQELSNKIQEMLHATGLLPSLERTERWNLPDNADDRLRQETFSTWFETKLSELVGTATWDLEFNIKGNEVAKKKGATSAASNARRYAVFLETLNLTARLPDEDEAKTDVMTFLDSVNQNQYGLLDVLCQAALEILQRTALKRPAFVPINADLRSTTLDLVEALGDNFIRTLSDSPDNLSTDDASNIALYIAELALDQAIHMVLSERLAVENALSATSRRKGGALAVAKDLRLRSEANSASIKEMLELAQQWSHVFERLVIWQPASQALYSESPNLATFDSWNTDVVLRFWWLRGRYCQVQEEAKEGLAWFHRCLKVFQSATPENEPLTVLTNCQYDAIIDQNSVSLRIKALDMLRFTLDAKERFAEEDYEGVISRLQPLISHSDMSAFAKTLEEQHESLELLAKSYSKLGQHSKVWECRMASLVHFTEALINYGCSSYVSDKANTKTPDNQHLVRMLSMINYSLNELIKLSTGDHMNDFPAIKDNSIFLKTNLLLLHMTSQYMFRHPDFIPLVNNFVNPEAPIHAPSATTKSNGFNVLMVRLWVWTSHMIRQYTSNEIESPEQVNETQKQLAELLSDVHDDLGEREICGADKGKFLERTLHTLRLNKKTISKRSLFQCYYCLYNVNVGTDTDAIEEHFAAPRKMDRKAAGELFDLLVPSIIDKLDRGTQLKNDLKEVIDDVAKEFGDPPLDNPLVKLNQNIINTYLASPIEYQSSLENFCRRCALNVIDVADTRHSEIPSVYFNIYWIRGKMYQAQIKYRSKVNAEKTMENLDDAVEQYLNHLYLQPFSFSAWYAIGSCYMQLADEELIWSASNIITHKDRIAEYQAKAFHCFMQAIYLGIRQQVRDGDEKDPNHPSEQHRLFNLYYDFGNLLYSMCCPPMNMEAFKVKSEKAGMMDDGSRVSIKHREPTQRDGYKLSLIMYSRALKQSIPNQVAWRLFLMIGKCYGKLQRPPQEVLAWYKQSVDRCKPSLGQHGHHEVILEPIYKLCAVLIKYLYRHQIQPSEVASYFEESDKHDGEKQDSDMMDPSANHDEESVDHNTAEVPDYRDSQSTDHHHDNDTVDGEHDHEEHEETVKTIPSSHSIAHLKSEEAAAYQLIFDRLAMVRKIDRRHWHHRPIFRHAWMHYYIYRDAEQAKADMMPLFALKSNLKSHISIWKPGFERPGKHFEYAHQYTVFMIELAQVTNDANTLKILCRKLRKNQPVLLYDKEIYGAAYTAYLEVIQNYLHKHHNSQKKQSSVIGVIPKAPFERKCDEWLRAIVVKEPKPELLVLLTDLFDIKKLNQGHVSDLNSDELIRQCMIALLFAETGIQQELVDLIIPVVDGNSFRIIERDGPIEDIKRNDLEGPKVIPANIFHQATRLYRWPPAQRSKPSINEANKNGLTTPAGTVSSEPGLNDSGSPAQHPTSTAPRSETPPPQAMQMDTEDDPVPTRSSLPITDLLSSG